MSDNLTPPNVGAIIGQDIGAVQALAAPIISTLAPGVGQGIIFALKVLSVAEPAAYNAVAALISGQDLTPEQTAAIADCEKRLQNPDSYLA